MEIKQNCASQEQIKRFFSICSDLFNPPFSSSIDIEEYSKKIRDNALTIETWHNKELVSLIAAYVSGSNIYIPYFCTKSKFRGLGLGQSGFNHLIKMNPDCDRIELEVRKNNNSAINFYKKIGFSISSETEEKYKMIFNTNPLVSISCIVYNHEHYLRECLDGFVMQKTNFAFEVLVHDDASTDKSADIIREYTAKYPDIFKPIFQTENQYSKGIPISVTFQFPRAKGKYIALCEGDDYWTDPLKLQKQVDFLEANPEYSMCFHAANLINDKTLIKDSKFSLIENRDYSGVEIFETWQVATASVVFRKTLLTSKIYKAVFESKNFIYGDTPLFCAASCVGKLRGMTNVMSIYRHHDGGMTMKDRPLSYRIKFCEHIFEFGNIFSGDFCASCTKVVAQYCVEISAQWIKKHNFKDAMLLLVYSLRNSFRETVVAAILFLYKNLVKVFS